MRPSDFLLALGVMFFLVQSSSALKCYLCDHLDEKECLKAESTDCGPSVILAWVGCTKWVFTVGETKRIKKECVNSLDKGICDNLKGDHVQCYFCKEDGCNGSRGLQSSIWMWPVTTLLAVVSRLFLTHLL